MASLRVLYDGRMRGCFEWRQDSIVIGRDGTADIDLSGLGDTSISRVHARIDRKGASFEIRDVGATNSVYVNGRIATVQSLEDNDEIRIGNAALVFTSHNAPQRGAADGPSGIPLDDLLDKIPPDTKTTYIPIKDVPLNLRVLQVSQQRLLALYDLSREFYACTSLSHLIETVLAVVCRVTKARRAFVSLFDEDGDGIASVIGRNMVVSKDKRDWPVSRTLLESVMARRESIVTDNALADPRLSEAQSVRQLQIRSIICCPLTKGREVIGLIYADNAAEAAAFGSDDLDLLRVLSLHVEAAIQMAQSREEMLERNARLQRENALLKGDAAERYEMVGSSPALLAVMERVRDISHIPAQAEICILVTGETGTGKELVARRIHAASARRKGPFIAVNCASIPEHLVEAELFGIEKGVATGVTARPGLFEAADHGVLFLDEIGDMNLLLQAKILRAIQNRAFVRVGASRETTVDVWIIAATNKDLQAEVAAKHFRSDLYYRLKVVEITVPPLRERHADIEPLIRFFLEKHSLVFGKRIRAVHEKAMQALSEYSWPGNVRQLENTIAGSVAFCHGTVLRECDLPPELRTASPTSSGEPLVTMEEMEKRYLSRVLRETDWNISKAARILGMGRQAVYQKIEKHKLAKDVKEETGV